jgi:uncharacterized protein YcbK (DUF882 family)
MNTEFMQRLIVFRRDMGVPLVVTSGYRCPDYDKAIRAPRGQTGIGAHARGRAVDLHLWGSVLWNALEPATAAGMLGIGLHQSGKINDRFAHFDNLLADPGRPRPWVWTY